MIIKNEKNTIMHACNDDKITLGNWDGVALKYYAALGGKVSRFPQDTISRIDQMSEELLAKRQYDKFTVFDSDNNSMILFNGIKVFSFCEHHLLPFFGYASVAYIPEGKILGASKPQRIIDKLASKPTIQENLTQEIAKSIEEIIKPKGVGVTMTCIHTCMFGRGINTSTISMETLLGNIHVESEVRNEYHIRIKRNAVLSTG